MSHDLLHPYVFVRTHVAKPWAGRRLRDLFVSHESVPDGTGETVELGTLPDLITPIDNGNASGLSLADVAERTGWRAIVGYECDDFPIMVKLLDTVSPLSVQVHPSDATSECAMGKHESWIVLACDEDSCIFQGVEPGVKEEAFWAVMENGDPADVLLRREIEPQTFVDSPVGMIHSIGPGITLLEVQQNCNTTYRIRDWPSLANIQQREMHLEKARSVADLTLQPPPVIELKDDTSAVAQTLRQGYPYDARWHNIDSMIELLVTSQCAVIFVLEGELAVRAGEQVSAHLQAGSLCLIPAALERVSLVPFQTCGFVEIRPRDRNLG